MSSLPAERYIFPLKYSKKSWFSSFNPSGSKFIHKSYAFSRYLKASPKSDSAKLSIELSIRSLTLLGGLTG